MINNRIGTTLEYIYTRRCTSLYYIILPIFIFIILITSYIYESQQFYEHYQSPSIPWKDQLADYPILDANSIMPKGALSSCGLRYRVFCLHAANWDLTVHIIETFKTSGKDFVLIDVSFAEDTRAHAEYINSTGITILYPHVPLTLSMGMEYIRRMSIEWNLDYFLYSHNDVIYKENLLSKANADVCDVQHSNPRWGFLKFHYDIFCAYHMEAFIHVGMWDPYIPNYRADWDYYHRMKMAGYEIIESKSELGQYIHHKASMTSKSITQTSNERNFGWRLTDDIGRYMYYQAKWNSRKKPGNNPEAYRNPFGGEKPPDYGIIPAWIWKEFCLNQAPWWGLPIIILPYIIIAVWIIVDRYKKWQTNRTLF